MHRVAADAIYTVHQSDASAAHVDTIIQKHAFKVVVIEKSLTLPAASCDIKIIWHDLKISGFQR